MTNFEIKAHLFPLVFCDGSYFITSNKQKSNLGNTDKIVCFTSNQLTLPSMAYNERPSQSGPHYQT